MTSRIVFLLLALLGGSALPGGTAQAAAKAGLSGRGAFVFSSVTRYAALKPLTCPGKLGNSKTRCAVTLTDKKTVQRRVAGWKGWKQTDPWQADSAAFTSDGRDGYAVSAIKRIGNKGTLFIFSEF